MKSQDENIQTTREMVTEWQNTLFEGRTLRIPVQKLKEWPLVNYLLAAMFQAQHLNLQRDDNELNWQTPAWDFGRFAKAHPSLFELDENEALRVVKETIGGRFWEQHLHMDAADAEMAFDNIWVSCRAVPGYDPVTVAIMEATRAENDSGSGPAGYETFLLVARSLHRQLNGSPFMLPCHKLAPLLNCKPMTISRYRQKAIRDGHLKIVKEHSFRSATKGEATEFELLA
jgi:hypothetical protein